MSVALADLVDRLEADVPASGGRPSATQYENAIKDAVTDFNNRVGIRRRTSLTIVSGTATYTLPTDFHSLIEFSNLPTFNGSVAISSDGLIPLSSGSGITVEEYEIVNGQITIYPTPGYGGTRYLWYRAGHYLNVSDAYPNMTEADVAIIMLKARANAWRYTAEGSFEGMSYRFGSVQVDKKQQVNTMQERASKLEGEYNEAIEKRIGAITRQTQYSYGDLALFMNDLV